MNTSLALRLLTVHGASSMRTRYFLDRLLFEYADALTQVSEPMYKLLQQYNRAKRHNTKHVSDSIQALLGKVELAHTAMARDMIHSRVTPWKLLTVFENVVSRLRLTNGIEKRIDINFLLPDETLVADMDGLLLFHVLLELGQNAINAIQKEDYPGEVIFSAEPYLTREKKLMMIEVRDDAAGGISRDKIQSLFIYPRHVGNGGIGLPMCFDAVTASGGTLSVKRRDVGGVSIFQIALPIGENENQ